MSSPITIRPARIEDIDEVYQIEQKSFPQPWSYDLLRQEFFYPLSRQLAATTSSEKIVGYLLWRIDFSGAEGHILDLAVHPDFRRQKIGSDLLSRAIGMMKTENVSRIFLEVREDNLAARKLYEKFGFQFIQRRPNYYHEVAGLVYQLNL